MIVAIEKKIDYKGRVHIPHVVLRKSNIKPLDNVYFEVDKDGSIVMKKVRDGDLGHYGN